MSWTSEQWKQAVRDLGYCVRCGRRFGDGEAPDVCHRNEGKGMGIKVPDVATWAGCRTCHVEIDSGKDMPRDQRRAESDCMIVRTLIALVLTGFFDCFADTAPKNISHPCANARDSTVRATPPNESHDRRNPYELFRPIRHSIQPRVSRVRITSNDQASPCRRTNDTAADALLQPTSSDSTRSQTWRTTPEGTRYGSDIGIADCMWSADMTHDEMIAVIQAHKRGEKIEYLYREGKGLWSSHEEPIWNFSDFDYRIKPNEPREWWMVSYEHNPPDGGVVRIGWFDKKENADRFCAQPMHIVREGPSLYREVLP